jgi:magnesium-transporting ATPase (P-type)
VPSFWLHTFPNVTNHSCTISGDPDVIDYQLVIASKHSAFNKPTRETDPLVSSQRKYRPTGFSKNPSKENRSTGFPNQLKEKERISYIFVFLQFKFTTLKPRRNLLTMHHHTLEANNSLAFIFLDAKMIITTTKFVCIYLCINDPLSYWEQYEMLIPYILYFLIIFHRLSLISSSNIFK